MLGILKPHEVRLMKTLIKLTLLQLRVLRVKDTTVWSSGHFTTYCSTTCLCQDPLHSNELEFNASLFFFQYATS